MPQCRVSTFLFLNVKNEDSQSDVIRRTGDFVAADGSRGNINTGHYTLLDGGEGNFYCDRLPESIYSVKAITTSQSKSTPTKKAPLSSSDTRLLIHHTGDPSLSRKAATSATLVASAASTNSEASSSSLSSTIATSATPGLPAASPSSSEEPSDNGTSSSPQPLLNNIIFAVLLTTSIIAGPFLSEILFQL